MFEKLEKTLDKLVNPIATKLGSNDTLTAISEGFIRTTPLIIGIAIFTILGSLQIPGWSDWLKTSGMNVHFEAAINAATNILSLYVVFSIAFSYAKKKGENAIICGFLALGSFVLLMPQTIEGKEGAVNALSFAYLGADGMIVALLVGIIVAKLCVFMAKRNLTFKMPASVPSMVSESLSPMIIAIVVFFLAFLVRVGFAYTSYGNIFDCITTLIGIPFMKIGASIPVLVGIGFLANLLWFFGIHPNAVKAPLAPILITVLVAQMEAYGTGVHGNALPYYAFGLVYISGFGGQGHTLGLIVSMFGAKSKRYRQMFKIGCIPNVFNINEPMIFGMPVMLNPIFLIPMLFCSVITGLFAYAVGSLISFDYNPAMLLLPWTTPFFLKGLLAGGIPLMLLMCFLLIIDTIMYYPFFRIADKKALLEEQAVEMEAAKQGEQEHVR